MDNMNDKYKKKNPFSVPEGYFDELTGRIMEKIEEESKPKKMGWARSIKPYMSLAAIFMLALLIVQILFPVSGHESELLQNNKKAVVQVQEKIPEDTIFDSQFNPTSEEIIEYLASEVDTYEMIYAEIY